jgi:uncharacterized protein YkwD
MDCKERSKRAKLLSRVSFSLFLLFYSSFLQAQTAASAIDLNNLNVKLLEELVLKDINALRAGLDLSQLKKDETLRLAATDQAAYMQVTGIIGHGQKVKGKETPSARVVYYKGTHGTIGENCYAVIVGSPFIVYGEKDATVLTTYQQAADALFNGWKHSPGHYKNMVTPEYMTSGIGFAVDKEKKEIYSAQVFGDIPYVPPPGVKLTDNSYGIYESSPAACDPIKEYDFLSQILTNHLILKGDSIFIYFHDIDYFTKVLNSSSDAIAVDVVERRQFPCNGPNVLHGSPVYDGVMLAPVYWPVLQKNNLLKAKREMFAYVGTLPKGMKDYQLNTMVIKSKRVCRYSYPVQPVFGPLKMFDIYPYWDTISGTIRPDSFDVTLDYIIPFGRGKTELQANQQLTQLENALKANSEFIKSVEIKTFSSIEGSTEVNLKLQEARAKVIREKIAVYTNKEISWQVESHENWEEFYRQIALTRFAYLKGRSQAEIKELLRSRAMLDSLDFMLAQQRNAIIKISVSGSYGNNIPDQLLLPAFINAIEQGDSAQALIIQSRIVHKCIQRLLPLEALTDPVIPLERKFAPVISNQMAAKASRSYYLFDYNYLMYTKNAVAIAPGYLPLKFNIASNALEFSTFSGDTLIDMDKLEGMIKGCFALPKNKELVNRLMLNYYINGVPFYYDNKVYDKMSNCLSSIRDYFYNSNLSQDEALKVAKFFNSYSKFDWSMELMYSWIKKEEVSEDFLFTFVRTGALYPYTVPEEEYFTWVEKARKRNPERFCKWIYHDYQLLRQPRFKELYCRNCH